ncbi:triose-phosphate isomerase [Helicobacter pylori]|uniref:triose-phosphate isomerase n=1 Tax=Helicobacter pylori TaxID=210 RepID=UPI00026A4902|nr:triose-phosphate isomerase [Helicobacter pylori]EJB62466.1 triosephosphate isomerase [Helicobacter pylori Hp H-41]
MTKIAMANFKSAMPIFKSHAYLKELEKTLKSQHFDRVFVFPDFLGLLPNAFLHFTLGAQNAYPKDLGAFTGEITSKHLEELKIHTLLIGHSERRALLKESPSFLKEKFDFFKDKNFKIVYCIGEDLTTREKGFRAVKEFLSEQLETIDLNYSNLIVAYEPIWAIGTKKSASLEDIYLTHGFLKQILNQKTPLLYGGSVNTQNAKEILGIDSVDGLLIGSTSLELENFKTIISFL